MEAQLVARLNELWRPVYPHLAKWISRWCPPGAGWALEIGPFSGGICDALMNLFEDLRTVCIMPQDEVARTIAAQFKPDLKVFVGLLESLPFEASFDFAVFRGGFFFLNPEIIIETYRILRPGATAILGGGYGPLTPGDEIQKIAEKSKQLNYQLGKKWISREKLEEMVREAGMERSSEITEEGGLWLLLKKDIS